MEVCLPIGMAEVFVGLVLPTFLVHVAPGSAAGAGDVVGRRGPLNAAKLAQLFVEADAVLGFDFEHAGQIRVGALGRDHDIAENVLGIVELLAVIVLERFLVGKDLIDIEPQFSADGLALVDRHVHVGEHLGEDFVSFVSRDRHAVADVHPALGLDVGAAGPLAPGHRGKDNIAVEQIGRVAVDFLDDGEHFGDRGPHEGMDVGQVDVGGVHPEHGEEIVVAGALHHTDGHGVAHGCGAFEALSRDAPHIGDVVAPLDVADGLVKRQAPRETAHETLAHRVGLTRLRMRAATFPPDIAGQQMEVDDRDGVVLAVEHLVVADAPVGEHAALAGLAPLDRGLGPELGDPLDFAHGDTAAVEEFVPLDHLRGRVARLDAFDVLAPSGRVFVEPLFGHDRVRVLRENHVGERVQVGDVAVQGLKMIRVARIDRFQAMHRARTSRVGDQRGDILVLLVIGDAPEQDGV